MDTLDKKLKALIKAHRKTGVITLAQLNSVLPDDNSTPEKIEAFFVSRGVSKDEFQKAFSSFAVESKVLQAEDLNKRYKITGTPTIVVNGKYVTDVGMAGDEDKLFQVVNET